MIRQVASANVILLAQYAVGALVPLLLIPHIVRSIGLAEYGHLAVALAWGSYGAVVVQYAFHLTGPRRVAQLAAGESPADVFAEISLAKLLLLLGVLPLMVLVIAVMPNGLSSLAAWLLLLGLPLAAGLNATWFLQAQCRFMWVCIAAIIGSAATLLFGFNFVNGSDSRSIAAAAAATVLGPVLAGAITLLFAWVPLRSRGLRWSAAQPSHVLKEGWPLFASQFLSALYMVSGPIVINYLLDAQAAGAYSAVERVINALVAACLLTHIAAYPRLAVAYTQDRASYWRLLKFVLVGYVTMTATLGICVWVLRDMLARYLLGGIAEGYSALLAWGLVWLMVGIFGTALTGYLAVSGRSREVMPLTLKILAFTVALGIPAVVIFGSAGWMAALVLSQTLVLLTGYRLWRREYAY